MSETAAPSVVQAAQIGAAVNKRFEDAKLLYYRPCCRAHHKRCPDAKCKDENQLHYEEHVNKCPTYPCPDSKHASFHMSDKRIRLVFGGNRSAKSTTCLIEVLMMACFKVHPIRKTKNPTNGRFRIFETDFGIVEKLIIPAIKEWVPEKSLYGEGKNKEEKWKASYDPKYHLLRLKGGNVIDFMSYDQEFSKSESVELDGVMADEQMPEEIYNGTMARLISKNGKFWMGVTPLYDLSWAMKFLDSTDPNLQVFYFDIQDNPHLTQQAIEDFEASITNENEKEARLHGRFMELSGLVYKELRADIHFIKHSEPKSEYPVIFVLDPHPRKPSVMGWAYVSGKEDVVFFDEMEMGGTARDITRMIRERERKHTAPTLLRLIDPAAKAQGSDLAFQTDTLKEFEREGLSFTLADNSEGGYNIVHEYLSYNPNQPIGPFNRPRVFFTQNVPKTWYGMTHLMWDDWTFKRSMREKKEVIRDYKKDFPDVVRYALATRPNLRSFYRTNSVAIGNHAFMQQQQNKQDVRKVVFGTR